MDVREKQAISMDKSSLKHLFKPRLNFLGWRVKIQSTLKNSKKIFYSNSVSNDFHYFKIYISNPCSFYKNSENTDNKKENQVHLFSHSLDC